MRFEFDVIVVGAGHAGCEAAVASARMGASTLLITADLNRVAQMSCNPAVGGIAKGQIVREIDALGGMTGIVADKTAIQFRMLNHSKGPAVWSPRVQSDRTRFIDEWRRVLDSCLGLELFQDMVSSLIIESTPTGEEIPDESGIFKPYRVDGVRTALGFEFHAPRVILTAGTFLGGLMHFGRTQIAGGRISEPSSEGITSQLVSLGFESGRMKTGTPARISGKSVDFSLCQQQDGDDSNPSDGPQAARPGSRDFHKFSFLPEVRRVLKVRPCFITHTNSEVHEVLSSNLADSPLYNGQIKSIGPRYCPSIETKIVTFADKDSHQLFLEPEGESTDEYYINGFSSSLPWRVQLEALQKIPALRDVHFYRPGYAIEYDYFPPTQLTHDLQTKIVSGLYFAGQINGTTGYEEAAAQGLLAGVNAALAMRGEQPLVLRRDEAYIGVLIDDLVTKGVDEPYRMFTSRAEYRILLRQDDADMRLTPVGHRIGLADDYRYEVMLFKRGLRDDFIGFLERLKVSPSREINVRLEELGTAPLSIGVKAVDLLRRPQITLPILLGLLPRLSEFSNSIAVKVRDFFCSMVSSGVCEEGSDIQMSGATNADKSTFMSTQSKSFVSLHVQPESANKSQGDADNRRDAAGLMTFNAGSERIFAEENVRIFLDELVEAVEILVKYDGYIHRERDLAEKALRLENVRLSPSLDYSSIKSLSIEARQKLSRVSPSTIGHASRIPGVSPADIQILLMLCGR